MVIDKIYDTLDKIGFLTNLCGTRHIAEILKYMQEIKVSYSYDSTNNIENLFNEAYENYNGQYSPYADYWGGFDNNWKDNLKRTIRAFSEEFRPTSINQYRLVEFLPDDFMAYFEFGNQDNFENVNLICALYNYLEYLFPVLF